MAKKKIAVDRFDPRLAATYRGVEDKQRHYDDWAASYESDLVGDMDYVAFRDAGDIFAARVDDRATRILDVACGTGLAGEYLASKGYRHIDGVDFSAEMLAIAGQRGIYRDLWQHDFTLPKLPAPGYGALICVGLFSFNDPGMRHLHHVVNCVKPGAYCVVTVNGVAWRQLNLESDLRRESKAHGFEIVDIAEAEYIRGQDIDARVLTIRR